MFGLGMGRMGVNGGAGAAAPVMPDGALGIWYASDYVASPRPHIPNSVSAVAGPRNVLSIGRRCFADGHQTLSWGVNGGTATDSAATAPDGSNDASTIVAAADWYLTSNGQTFPAGTYTIGCSVKRNTGSDQQFKIGDFNSTQSTTQTATSAWQRFSHTFTTAGNAFPVLISFDRSTGASLQICDLEIFEGSSDLGPETPAGHLLLGKTAYTAPTCAAGELDVAAAYGTIQFASGTSLSAFTSFCTVKKTATGSDQFHAFLSKIQSYGNLTFYVDCGPNYSSTMGRPLAALGGASISGLNPGLWQLYDAYSVIGYRFDGATMDVYIDGVNLYSVATTGSAVDIADFFVGIIENPTYTSGAKFNAIGLYESALTDAQMLTATQALHAKATADGLTLRDGAMLQAMGDSITVGFGLTQGYPDLYGDDSTQTQLFGVNLGASGTGLTYVEDNLADVLARFATTTRVGKKNILTIQVGANDLVGLDAAGVTAYLVRYAAVCDEVRAAGVSLAIGTVLPRSDLAASFNTNRATVNTAISGWVGSGVGKHVDAVFDFAGDATMGPDAAASDLTYYQDGVHPTAAGQAILEGIYKTAVDAL
jgi:lysophospholipase L1-like esterase